MRALVVKVPADLDDKVRRAAQRSGRSTSAVVREALEAWVARTEPTVGSLCPDLVGCVEGPGDLSTNPAHLDGFGT